MCNIYLAFKVRVIDHTERLLQKINKTVYYKNRFGVKALNRTSAGAAETKFDKTPVELDVNELYLPFDFLKDEYTLLGVSIPYSPHIELMRACASGKLDGCEYIERAKKGTVDGRDAVFETNEYYFKSFNESKAKFESGCAEPISFYTVNGKKYISNGKHRAAMAAYLGKPLYGYEIPRENLYSTAVDKMLKIMKNSKMEYKANIEHIESIKC